MDEPQSIPTYVVTCLYGLERVLADEVEELLGPRSERHWCEVAFPFAGEPARLLGLRTGGNVFRRFDSFRIGHTVPDLQRLGESLRALPLAEWEDGLDACGGEDVRGRPIGVHVKRTGQHNYSYADVEEDAIGVLTDTFARRVTLGDAPLELRIVIRDDRCVLTGRLSRRPLSVRRYKVRHIPAETDPTLAAAMVRLSGPRPGDVFLDPFCGSGTIAVERGLVGPARRLVAGDVKSKCLAAATANASAAGVEVDFGLWDAGALPFANRTFTRLVTNPPQGNPTTGRPWSAEELAALLRESFRVLEYGGVVVLFMRRDRILRKAVAEMPAVQAVRRLTCNWKGRPGFIHVLAKAL